MTARLPLCAVLASLMVLACDATRPSVPPGGSQAAASQVAPVGPPSSFGLSPSPSPPDAATPITLEPGLLAYLPVSIEGTPVNEDLDVASEALLDPALPAIASGLDTAVAVDTGSGNLVTAWVVRLRPAQFGEEAWRQWRDSYDEGACSAAGGVVGNAQAEIDGRDTFITTCAEALRTYHVWLEEENVLVSASSIGDGRFGEKLMDSLRIPE